MPLPNMKLIIEVEEGQQGEGEGRSIGGYVITTRVVVADPEATPHDHTNLPWLALIFVVALQHEIRRAFGEPNTGATYVLPPGSRDPVADLAQMISGRQKPVTTEKPAEDEFLSELPIED